MTAVVHRSADRHARFRSPPAVVRRRRCHAPLGGQHPHFGRPTFDPRLRPRRVHWGCNGELSTLAVQYQLGAGSGELAGRLRPGQAEQQLTVGDGVVLTQPVGPGSMFAGWQQELFRGTIGRVRPVIETGPDRETFEAVAYGP